MNGLNKEIMTQRLNEIMIEFDLNTYTLGEILHLSPSTISRYLNGKMAPKITAIEIIASRFNLNPAWVMGHDVEKVLRNDDEITTIAAHKNDPNAEWTEEELKEIEEFKEFVKMKRRSKK